MVVSDGGASSLCLPLCRQRWGHVDLNLSAQSMCRVLSACPAVSPRLSSGFYQADRDIDSMLGSCWPTVYDAEPTLA